MKKIVTYFILFFSFYSVVAQNTVKFIQANTSSTVRQVNNTPVVIIPKSNNTTTEATRNPASTSAIPKHTSKKCQHCLKRIGPAENNQQKKILKDPVK